MCFCLATLGDIKRQITSSKETWSCGKEVGWKESLFVVKSEPLDRRVKCQGQGYLEYYVLTLKNVVNRIQSPHSVYRMSRNTAAIY